MKFVRTRNIPVHSHALKMVISLQEEQDTDNPLAQSGGSAA